MAPTSPKSPNSSTRAIDGSHASAKTAKNRKPPRASSYQLNRYLSSRKPPRASSYQLNRYLSTPAASIHERTSTNSSPWTTEISRAEMGRKLKEIMESIQGMDHMNGTSSSMAAGRNYEDEMMVELERIEKELET